MSDAFLLLDIHSFNRKGFGPDVDVIVLDNVPGTWYGKKLYDIMKSYLISVAYIAGSDVNDITQEARYMGIPAIIIEYGEFIPITTIDQINKSVIEWIHLMLNSKNQNANS